MALAIQLDLFEKLDENAFLRRIIIDEKETNRKTSKKLFALNAKLQLELLVLRHDIEYLKDNMIKNEETP